MAEAKCKENNDMAYFETSAKEGVSINKPLFRWQEWK
jgi:hypothetical protein